MKRMILALMLVAVVSIQAQETAPLPNELRVYRVGDYAMPDGKMSIIFTVELLEKQGWKIEHVNLITLPKGFTIKGIPISADTTAYDIIVRWPVTVAQVAPATVAACPGTDPFASLPGFRGACVDGGWRMVSR